MAEELYCNDPGTTLASAITSTSSTSISVTSSTGYPSTGNFRILIDTELIQVTAVSGTTWTVVRGIESTTAATHLSGANVNAILSAGALDAIRSNQSSFGTFSSLPSTGKAGDRYKQTDGPYEFIFDGSEWQAFLNGAPVAIPPKILTTTTTTLNTSLGSTSPGTGGTMVVTSNFGSMPSTPFYVLVESEQLLVTAVSGTSWTVVRGDGPTTAAAHTSGATITLINFSLTFAGSSSSTPGSIFYTQGGGSWTFESASSIDGWDHAFIMKTPLAFSAPYTVTLLFSMYNTPGVNYINAGLGLWDSSNAAEAIACPGVFYNNGWTFPNGAQSWNGYGNFYGSLSGATGVFSPGGVCNMPTDGSPYGIKFIDDGTNWLTYFSLDSGLTWSEVQTVARNTFISPEYIGPHVSPRNSRCGMKVLSFQQLSGVH